MEILLILVGLVSGLTGAIIVQKAILKSKTLKVLKDAEIDAENIKKKKSCRQRKDF